MKTKKKYSKGLCFTGVYGEQFIITDREKNFSFKGRVVQNQLQMEVKK